MQDTEHHNGKSRVSRFIDEIEETIIAIILALMVTITFINVVLRYGFNSGLIWGLEMVTFLFAWLVLLGISLGSRIWEAKSQTYSSKRFPYI